jgi:lysozyme
MFTVVRATRSDRPSRLEAIMPLEGVDVSHNNGRVAWPRVRAAGTAFAYIKATEGVTFTDPACSRNLAESRAAGIAPGLYHFYHHDVDAQQQAAHFLKVLGTPKSGDLPPALDVEAPGDGSGPIAYSASEAERRLSLFVDTVERAIGRTPVIYTYPSAWKEITANWTRLAARCPLWIASYANAPTLVGGWTDYAVWQYTDQGEVDGIGTSVDRDRFGGDATAFEDLRVRGLVLAGLALLNQDGNVRAAPGLGGRVIKTLQSGTGVAIVDGPQVVKDRDWWKVDDGDGTVGWCSSKVLSPA